MKKVLYVGFRFLHHSKNAGYDRITQYPGSRFIDARKVPFFGSRLMKKSGGRFALIFTGIFVALMPRNYDAIHFFYADNLAINRKWLGRKRKVIATIHLNTADFSVKKLKMLKNYDAVVCLSRAEAQALKSRGLPAVFIPHGFSRPVFSITSLEKFSFDESKINVCLLGFNYRDFDVFEAVVRQMEKARPDVMFHVVGQRDTEKKRLKKYEDITVYPHIDDDEYYSLIQACDYNFLPLIFATANNALMEAQALGTVSILPRISGISDYADTNENLFYANASECIALFMRLEKCGKSNALKKFAEQFEWNRIYKELSGIYGN